MAFAAADVSPTMLWRVPTLWSSGVNERLAKLTSEDD